MGKISLFFFAIFLFAILSFSGCTQTTLPQGKTALQYCVELCQAEIAKGTDLSAGPCIGNPIVQAPDVVCDIAHYPRANVDNQQENQCSAFAEGKARHFVELDEQCNLIKQY